MDAETHRDRRLQVGKIKMLTQELNNSISKWYQMENCIVKIIQIDESINESILDKKPVLMVRCFTEIED